MKTGDMVVVVTSAGMPLRDRPLIFNGKWNESRLDLGGVGMVLAIRHDVEEEGASHPKITWVLVMSHAGVGWLPMHSRFHVVPLSQYRDDDIPRQECTVLP